MYVRFICSYVWVCLHMHISDRGQRKMSAVLSSSAKLCNFLLLAGSLIASRVHMSWLVWRQQAPMTFLSSQPLGLGSKACERDYPWLFT